ncbi:hypothetical protein Pyn_21394 [Prunus yedoensis var. nudiflora]|uniref:Uncharacterized protein n=1 Tax=Prunus yedoensis var. nudiflora TaxID=2094558 RepID=A0A314ZFZ8_PRUYE|nr:hypothetical protein Pyn_21394 [Prunus yedoensis var. nudiflora]
MDKKPSETTQVTGGTLFAVSLSFTRSSRNGATSNKFLNDSQTKVESWVASSSDSGRQSGMVSNPKSSRPSRELGPRDLRKRLWLNSALTKGYVKASMVEEFY